MKKSRLSFSILIPVYKGSQHLRDALDSIFRQNFDFYEIIVSDDNRQSDVEEIEKTKKILSQFSDKRIKYSKNKKNLGSQGNIKKLASLAKGDILFYLCQDDILAKNALQKTYNAFFLNKDVGAVTRPYFWFEDDVSKPVRAVQPPDETKDTVVSVFDGEKSIKYIFDSLGQLSGLAFRKKCIIVPFHLDVFPGHIYPFAGILRNHKCVYLKDFTVAVRIRSSQSRNISSIYNVSPTQSWIKMFNTVYKEKKFEAVRKAGIKNIATHYVGLVQVKNFGSRRALLNEVKVLLTSYWPNFFNLKFWFYTIVTLLTPRKALIKLSDNYKKYILSRFVKKINFSVTL